jgi:hypothetical protein
MQPLGDKFMLFHRPFAVLAAAATLALPLGGCDALLQIAETQVQSPATPLMPSVEYGGTQLVESPSKTMMAQYFCPLVVPNPGGIPGSAAVACSVAFGAPPLPSQMRVSFDLKFKVKNPNQFPIPVAELLAAVVVFPDKTNQSLGAACVAFCGADQPGCTGQPGPGACVSKSTDIKSIDDFKAAAAGFLVASGIQALVGQQPSFVMPQVVQDAEVQVTARFSFGPEALLQVLYELAKQSANQLSAGKTLDFSIPYQIQGAVWLDVGSLGRVAVGYGPTSGVWTIPAEQIIPKRGQ